MLSRVRKVLLFCLAILALSILVGACGVTNGIVDPHPASSWTPTLDAADVALLQQTFPGFLPPLIAPGTDVCTASQLLPANYSPAEFFGAVAPQPLQTTPLGISVQTNGYDSSQVPTLLPPQVTYFDCMGNQLQADLSILSWSPLNLVQAKMNVPQTPNAVTADVNLQEARVNLVEIDDIFRLVQSQLAILFPQIAQINPSNCEVVIEPTIFYVQNSTQGSSWAGGMTESLGNGRYRIHVMEFSMNQPVSGQVIVTNWKDYLVFESMNFYLESIGRPDLTF